MTTFKPSREAVEDIFQASRVLYLAMIDGEYPYVVALNYGYEDGFIYLHTGAKRSKVTLLKKNTNVAFFLEGEREDVDGEQACSYTVKFKTVAGRGTCEVIESLEDKVFGYDIIARQHSAPKGNYKEEALDKSVILKIKIVEATGKIKGFTK
ncbi:MAG: hypothetical protein C0608_11460 [Deltaproteobacteria bacterium]|nr:MAG: hypothetical protein C0608_11460 [Deltaproteobacteria bacterium]